MTKTSHHNTLKHIIGTLYIVQYIAIYWFVNKLPEKHLNTIGWRLRSENVSNCGQEPRQQNQPCSLILFPLSITESHSQSWASVSSCMQKWVDSAFP